MENPLTPPPFTLVKVVQRRYGNSYASYFGVWVTTIKTFKDLYSEEPYLYLKSMISKKTASKGEEEEPLHLTADGIYRAIYDDNEYPTSVIYTGYAMIRGTILEGSTVVHTFELDDDNYEGPQTCRINPYTPAVFTPRSPAYALIEAPAVSPTAETLYDDIYFAEIDAMVLFLMESRRIKKKGTTATPLQNFFIYGKDIARIVADWLYRRRVCHCKKRIG